MYVLLFYKFKIIDRLSKKKEVCFNQTRVSFGKIRGFKIQ